MIPTIRTMLLHPKLLSLPASLLVLIANSPCPTTSEAQWPYNLPPAVKYYPEDEVHIKRDVAIRERMAFQAPAGLRKMTGDEGEKFFLEYWSFDDYSPDTASTQDVRIRSEEAMASRRANYTNVDYWNETIGADLLPPFSLHSVQTTELRPLLRLFHRTILDSRAFQCPQNTVNCSSIGRPNSCCASDETCIIVTDTGLGDVGCCPDGQTCGGSVSSCDTANGYTSCPNSSNGGCCIPDYTCDDVGC